MEGVPFTPDVRMIRINGSVFPANGGGLEEDNEPVRRSTAARRQRRTRKQDGGVQANPIDDSFPASPATIGRSIIPLNPFVITKINEVASVASEQKGGQMTPPSNIPPGPIISGGQPTVVLKKKAKTSKVLLKKKIVAPAQQQQQHHHQMKTSGKSRKIIVKHVRNKIRKTRHAVKHANELPFDKLRALLIEKKLIKASSKAPESILRQIYADSLIVSKKTL